MKSIVKGNDFTMKIPVVKMVEGEKVAFPLPACTDIVVRMANSYRRTALAFEISAAEDNVILAHVEGDLLSLGTYALEVKGKLFGADWRSNEYEQIRIVDNNAAGDTAFTPDENEDSVEMDTAVVVLPPDKVVSSLVDDVTAAVKLAEEARTATEATDAAIKQAEEARAASEEHRSENETARQSAENQRANTEAQRITNENARIEAEKARVAAEEKRETDTQQATSQMQQKVETATAQMQQKVESAISDAEKRGDEAVKAAHVSVAYNAETASIDITTGE